MAVISQQFPVFYRENGVLTIEGLVDPEPILVRKLPITSVLHHFGDASSKTLDPTDSLYQGYTERIVFHNVTTHHPDHDRGTSRAVLMTQTMAEFAKRNRQFRREDKIEGFKTLQPRQLAVVNYAWIDAAYKYPDSPIGEFQEMEDKFWAVVHAIKQIDAITKRQHFIVVPTPMTLVGKSILDNRSMDSDQKLANIFRGFDERLLRHIWLFLNPALKERSVFGDFTEEQLRCVNFLYKSFGDKYLVLNLGYLFSWVRGNKNLTMKSSPIVKDFKEVQKYFLRGMLALQSFIINGESEAKLAEEAAEKMKQEDAAQKAEAEGSEQSDRFHQDRELQRAEVQNAAQLRSNRREDGDNEGRGSAEVGDRAASDVTQRVKEADIDRDLEMLEKLTARRFANLERLASKVKKASDAAERAEGEEIQEPQGYTSDIEESVESIDAALSRPATIQDSLNSKLTKLADSGAITAPELRKKLQATASIGKMEDPYGSGKTVEQASVVTQADLDVDEATATLDVPPTVLDSSMARDTLGAIAEKYNTNTIYKDILASAQAVQRGGVVIKNHTVNQVNTELGAYDVHTLEIQPLRGRPSVISARIPRVNEDGIFVAKGNRYVMRKQPVD